MLGIYINIFKLHAPLLWAVMGSYLVLTFYWKSQKIDICQINSLFKELSITVHLINSLFLPFSIVLIINCNTRSVTGVIYDAHFPEMIKKEIMRHMSWALFGNLILFWTFNGFWRHKDSEQHMIGRVLKEIPKSRNLAARG